jgi:hypothetical protein
MPLIRRDVLDRSESDLSTFAATSFASFLLHRHASVPEDTGRSGLAARPSARDTVLDRARLRR